MIHNSTGLNLALRVLLLTATAVLAGLALSARLSAIRGSRTPAACLAGIAAIAALVTGMVELGTNEAYALPQIGLTAASVATIGYRPVKTFGIGVVLLAVLVTEASLGLHGSFSALTAVQWVAAALTLAAATAVVTADPETHYPIGRRFGVAAFAAAGLFVGAGLLAAWSRQLRPDTFSVACALGRLVLIETALTAGAVVLLFVRRRAARVTHLGLAALVAAVAVTAANPAAAAPPPQAPAGRPVLQTIAVDGELAKLAMVPDRPGPNLVWISEENYRIGTGNGPLVPVRRIPGATGTWATINLPNGASVLRIAHGGKTTRLRVNAEPAVPVLPGITGPDGPECLTAVMGSAIAGGTIPTSCPDQTLTAGDRNALTAMVGSIADRHVPGIRLDGGNSPRATAARSAVLAEAAHRGIPVNGHRQPQDARIVLDGWSGAERSMINQVHDPAQSGVYLAPWLANGRLLGYSTGAQVALNYDTTEGRPLKYVDALTASGAQALASPAGFDAWSAAVGRPGPTGPARLYAALAGFSMMGTDPEMHMPGMRNADRSSGGWIENGRMTPVSDALPAS